MWPRVNRISDESRTASEKSDVRDVNAARNRLPKLCPSRPDPLSKRCRKSFDSRASSSLRATMQFRMSPGGSMLNSFRSRPEEPPSSLTVTTAERSQITGPAAAVDRISAGVATKRFRPFSSVERPVPPPIATTRKSRVRALFSRMAQSASLVSIRNFLALRLDRFLLANRIGRFQVSPGIGIEQFGKPRVLGKVLEVRVISRLESQLRFQTESCIEVPQGIFDVASETLERCQTVNDVVSLGILLDQLVQVLARCNVVPNIHQRDSIVEVLFGSFELACRRAVKVLAADVEMYCCPINEFLAGAGKDLLKMRLGLIEFMFLHRAEAGFIALQGLYVARILCHGFLVGGSFLSHVQDSSCALSDGELLTSALVARAIQYHSKCG